MEDKLQKDAIKLLNTKMWLAAERHRSNRRKKTRETMVRDRAEGSDDEDTGGRGAER